MLDFIKGFLKRWFRAIISLLVFTYFYQGFNIGGGLTTLIVAGLLLAIIEVFFHPLLKMLLLPLNIITLGFFQWLFPAVHLLIIAYFLKSVSFVYFSYQTFSFLGINIPGGDVNLVFSILVGSILFKFVQEGVKFLT